MNDVRKYSYHKYSEMYKRLFNKEKSKLKKVLSEVKIKHVGSTSIPGLGGKGIIDIAIKTPINKLNQFIKKLKKLGYENNLDHPIDDRRAFLQKRILYNGKERRIHIHLTLDDNFWNSFIVFRDYLRNHDKERDAYDQIKKEAVKHAKGKAKKYRESKTSFLKRIQKLALKEYSE